jgi:hypothetical protein
MTSEWLSIPDPLRLKKRVLVIHATLAVVPNLCVYKKIKKKIGNDEEKMPNCRDTVDEAIVPSRSACPSIRVQCIYTSAASAITSHGFFFYVGSRETS